MPIRCAAIDQRRTQTIRAGLCEMFIVPVSATVIGVADDADAQDGVILQQCGDAIKFVSLSPPRVVVTGRTKHFTSAFGEHVIAEEVEGALKEAMDIVPCEVAEFTVAPQLAPPDGGLPFHEWFIEFAAPPVDMQALAAALDAAMRKRNIYYRDLITGSVLRPLLLTSVARGGFAALMKARGMNDAQSKMPRLANDRRYVEGIT